MDTTEKRRFRRHDSSLTAELGVFDKNGDVVGSGSALTLNISRTGLLLRTEIDIPVEAEVTIVMTISGSPVHLKCQCMYCHQPEAPHFEAGMHILKIKDAERPLYFEMLEQLEDRAGDVVSLRPHTLDSDNLVNRISAEHKIINNYVVTISRMMTKNEPDTEQLFTLLGLMKTDTRTHFKIEETLFFDVTRDFLADFYRDIIVKLTLDHRALLKETDGILAGLKHRIDNKEALSPPLRDKITGLMDSIKQHAKIELTELFPHIEATPAAKKAIIKKINELTGPKKS